MSRSTSDGWTASQYNSFERGAIMNIRKNIVSVKSPPIKELPDTN